MINGVTILAAENIYKFVFTWTIPAIVTTIILSLVVLGLIIVNTRDLVTKRETGIEAVAYYIVCLLMGLLGCVVICFIGQTKTNEIDYTKYKVTIDDTVTMEDFMNHYDIIDQEGKIYTITIKDNSN